MSRANIAKPIANEVLTITPGLFETAPTTSPAAIPPIDALNESCFPLTASAVHSPAAKAAPALAIQKAGRAIVRKTALESDTPGFPAKRPAD